MVKKIINKAVKSAKKSGSAKARASKKSGAKKVLKAQRVKKKNEDKKKSVMPVSKSVKKIATKPSDKVAKVKKKKPAPVIKKASKQVKKTKPAKKTTVAKVSSIKPVKSVPAKKITAARKVTNKRVKKAVPAIRKKTVVKPVTKKEKLASAKKSTPAKALRPASSGASIKTKPIKKPTATSKKGKVVVSSKAEKTKQPKTLPTRAVKPPVDVDTEKKAKVRTKESPNLAVKPASNVKSSRPLKPAKPSRRKKGEDEEVPNPKDLEILDLPDFMTRPSKKDKKEPQRQIIRTIPVHREVIRQHKNEKVELNPAVVRTNSKIKIELEYMVKSSPRILYNFLSTPSGLSEWFADDVNVQNGIYSFFWEDSEEKARLLVAREFDLVRFKWLSTDNDDTYFEMRIKIDELTGDVALIVTDFAPKDELQEVQMLWDAQINDLLKTLGS